MATLANTPADRSSSRNGANSASGADNLGFSDNENQQIIDHMVQAVGIPRMIKLSLENQAKMKELLGE